MLVDEIKTGEVTLIKREPYAAKYSYCNIYIYNRTNKLFQKVLINQKVLKCCLVEHDKT